MIKNATVVNADKTQENALIYIKNGVVEFIGNANDVVLPENSRTIDAEG